MKKRWLLGGTTLAILCLSVPNQSFASTSTNHLATPKLLWKYTLPAKYIPGGEPYMDRNGNLYFQVGVEYLALDYPWLWSFTRAGKKRWDYFGKPLGTPGFLASEDGDVYSFMRDDVTGSQVIRKLNGAGQAVWQETLSSNASFLEDAQNGTFYRLDGGTLEAISPNGKKLWSVRVPHKTTGGTLELVKQVQTGDLFVEDTPNVSSDAAEQAATSVVYDINRSGTIKWSATVNMLINGVYAAPDGTVYVTTGGRYWDSNGYLYRFSSTGKPLWTKRLSPGETIDDLVFAPNGTIVAPETNDLSPFITAFSSNGNRLWQVPAPGGTNFVGDSDEPTVVVSKNSDIYFTMDNPEYTANDGGGQSLVAMNSNGKVKWMVHPTSKVPDPYAGPVASSPIVGDDGTVYVMVQNAGWHANLEYDDELIAYTPDGKKKWSFNTHARCTYNPLLKNGTMYFMAGNVVYALKVQG